MGVPVIVPFEASVSPAGSGPDPDAKLHVYPGVPPDAKSVCAPYAVLIVPAASELLTTVRAGVLIVMLNDWLTLWELPSCNRTVNVDTPPAVGVPAITPLEDIVRPPGSGADPGARPQLYGVLPPVPLSVWLYALPVVPAGRLVVTIVSGELAERVAPHKRIRHLEFVDKIPKSPSGKILRRVLVDMDRTKIF